MTGGLLRNAGPARRLEYGRRLVAGAFGVHEGEVSVEVAIDQRGAVHVVGRLVQRGHVGAFCAEVRLVGLKVN